MHKVTKEPGTHGDFQVKWEELLEDIKSYPQLGMECFVLLEDQNTNYEGIFAELLRLQESIKVYGTDKISEQPLLKEIINNITITIHAKINTSHTAIKVNILNKIPEKEFQEAVSASMSTWLKLSRAIEIDVSLLWTSFLNTNQDWKRMLADGDAEEIAAALSQYYEILSQHSKNKTKELVSNIFGLIPTGNMTCQDMTTWAFIKLLSSTEIDESVKKRIKVVNNGKIIDSGGDNAQPHQFIAIMDWTGKKREFIIDPWLSYVNTSVMGKNIEVIGFFGTYEEYKQIFNQIANSLILKKLDRDDNFDIYDDPCTLEEAYSINQKLNEQFFG
jgi:hypothetical protein